MERAKLKYHNDYLQVIMPDGQVIPDQVDIKIENEVGQRKIATAIVTMIVDITEIGDIDSVYSDKVKNIQEIELENVKMQEEINRQVLLEKEYINLVEKWKNEYRLLKEIKDNKKTWYQKLFNI